MLRKDSTHLIIQGLNIYCILYWVFQFLSILLLLDLKVQNSEISSTVDRGWGAALAVTSFEDMDESLKSLNITLLTHCLGYLFLYYVHLQIYVNNF